MTRHGLSALAVLVLLLLPIAAGCLTVPGPENVQKTPVVTTTEPTPVVTKMTAAKLTRTTAPTAPVTAAATPVPASTPGAKTTYATGTCPAEGGFPAGPGQTCPGTWLAATDTFSCCSAAPVYAGSGNTSIVAEPFVILAEPDDSPGSVIP